MSSKGWTLAVLVSVVSWACGEPASGPSGALGPSFATADQASGKYIVTFSGERVPVDFADDVRALGGVIDLSHDVAILTEAFRRAVLRRFVRRRLLEAATARGLLAWPHSGFHVHDGVWVPAEDGHHPTARD